MTGGRGLTNASCGEKSGRTSAAPEVEGRRWILWTESRYFVGIIFAIRFATFQFAAE
jgi:hypothetical protein